MASCLMTNVNKSTREEEETDFLTNVESESHQFVIPVNCNGC